MIKLTLIESLACSLVAVTEFLFKKCKQDGNRDNIYRLYACFQFFFNYNMKIVVVQRDWSF